MIELKHVRTDTCGSLGMALIAFVVERDLASFRATKMSSIGKTGAAENKCMVKATSVV